MSTHTILILVLGILLGLALASTGSITTQQSTPAASVSSPFVFTFNSSGVLNEAGSMGETSSPYFWLNSGGEMRLDGASGSTMLGDAPSTNKWYQAYLKNNPLDTDQGQHPQNLFRLLTRSLWDDVRVTSKFFVADDQFSASPNHNASNGLLLMSRYKDSSTLYYAGVRVDGSAVIKKKINGTYYTMAQKAVFPGTYGGWVSNQNLIPHDEWMTLRTETTTNTNGSVTVKLFLLRDGQTTWTKLVEATDSGQYGGTKPITGQGYTGIRTDFMDVKFDSFRLDNL